MPPPEECRREREWESLLTAPLSTTEVDRLARHLERCARCARAIDRLGGVDGFLETLRAHAATAEQPPAAPAEVEIAASTESKTRAGCFPTPSVNGGPIRTDFLSPPRGPDELGWLEHYRVLKLLGSGGMGAVFRAEDTRLCRPVALKVLQSPCAPLEVQDGQVHYAGLKEQSPCAPLEVHRQRFLREARATALLTHDHIVTIYQVGEFRGIPFLAMELLEGRTLEDRLADQTRPTPKEVVRWGREIAEGLAAAHARGLIHRDIKPANLWLQSPRQRIKILDFGLARMGDDQHLTTEGVIVGTPAYMAPEQARCQPVDARTDLYSLGVVLYRLCTGHLPFLANDAVGTLLAHSEDTAIPAEVLNPALPPQLAALVMRLLEKDPNRRPSSAREVARELAALRPSALPTAFPAPPAEKPPALPTATSACEFRPTLPAARGRRWPRRAGFGAALVVGALLAAVIGGYFAFRTVPTPGHPAPPIPSDLVDAVEELKLLNPGFKGRIEPIIVDGQVRELTICTDIITDIAPLQRLPVLAVLHCESKSGKGQLTDLRPLRMLPLTTCDLSGNRQLTDLSPLQGMKLEVLVIANTGVTDLTPLRGMPLRELSLSGTPVRDLSPLANCASLDALWAGGTPVTDFSAVANKPLVEIQLDENPDRDVPLLWKPTLQTINGIPAAAFRQEMLRLWAFGTFSGTARDQQQAIGKMLRNFNPGFDGQGVSVERIDKPKRSQIISLRIPTDQVGDLTPLQGFREWFSGKLDCRPVKLKVGKLTSLQALQGLPLSDLRCSGNPALMDLTPLVGIQLSHLDIRGTGVRDFSVLRTLPLVELWFDGEPKREAEWLRQCPHLKVNGKSVAEFIGEPGAGGGAALPKPAVTRAPSTRQRLKVPQ